MAVGPRILAGNSRPHHFGDRGLQPRHFAGNPVVVTLLAALAACLTGVAYVIEPRLLALPFALAGLGLLANSAHFRVAFVVLGGMAVLQSTDGLDMTKLAYFGGTFFAALSAYFDKNVERTEAFAILRPFVIASALTIPFIMATVLVARLHGTLFDAWMRDAATYLLAATVPFFVRDLASRPGAKGFLIGLFVVAGLLAAASYFISWSDRRGIAEFPIDRLLLPTFHPAAALFFFAIACTLTGTGGKKWTALSVVLPLILVLTATRSFVFLLVGPLVILMSMGQNANSSMLKIATAAVAAILLVFTLQPVLSGVMDVQFLNDRLNSTLELVADPNADRSFVERRAQTEAAWNQFLDNPIAGVGPGTALHWSTPWRISDAFTADTALTYLSKFGLVGVFIAIVWVRAFITFWRTISPRLGEKPIKYAAIAMFAYFLVILPMGNPFEDKGSSFTLLMLLSLLVAEAGSKPEEEATAP